MRQYVHYLYIVHNVENIPIQIFEVLRRRGKKSPPSLHSITVSIIIILIMWSHRLWFETAQFRRISGNVHFVVMNCVMTDCNYPTIYLCNYDVYVGVQAENALCTVHSVINIRQQHHWKIIIGEFIQVNGLWGGIWALNMNSKSILIPSHTQKKKNWKKNQTFPINGIRICKILEWKSIIYCSFGFFREHWPHFIFHTVNTVKCYSSLYQFDDIDPKSYHGIIECAKSIIIYLSSSLFSIDTFIIHYIDPEQNRTKATIERTNGLSTCIYFHRFE